MARFVPVQTQWKGFAATTLVAIVVISFAACSKQDEIRSYEEPIVEPVRSISDFVPPKSGKRGDVRLTYDTPEGWKEEVAERLRRAVFRVKKDDQEVEITVIALGAAAGDLLPNVNRWRDQVKLKEIGEDQLPEMVTEFQVAGVNGHYVEVVGPNEEAILAILAIKDDKSWYLKLAGDAQLALEEKERFLQFAKSLKIDAGEEGQ